MPSGIYKRKPMAQETKNKISISNTGKKRSLEAIEKNRQARLKNPNRYWLGKKRYEETKIKISLANIGKKLSEETKRKIGLNGFNYGMLNKKHLEETKRKISEKNKGKIAWNKGKIFSKETRDRMSKSRKGLNTWSKGRIVSKETRDKIGNASRGENNVRWIKDRTKLKVYGDDNKDRRSPRYGNWRLLIYKRDNYKCKINNANCNGRIFAHHILSYTEFPELRYDINNGITLCHAHHPRKRAEEKRLISTFKELVSVSKE